MSYLPNFFELSINARLRFSMRSTMFRRQTSQVRKETYQKKLTTTFSMKIKEIFFLAQFGAHLKSLYARREWTERIKSCTKVLGQTNFKLASVCQFGHTDYAFAESGRNDYYTFDLFTTSLTSREVKWKAQSRPFSAISIFISFSEHWKKVHLANL